MQESLCTFYPNCVYPETFGLVLAESNAVETPVLTHCIGAAPEVFGDPRQFVQENFCILGNRLPAKFASFEHRIDELFCALGAYRPYIRRILSWKDGDRPDVRLNEAFRMENVARCWRQELCR